MVRTYQGATQEEAVLMYAADAPAMAEDGWAPVAQTWATGDWPAAYYLVSTLLIIVGIGILLLALLILFKPRRTLVVTYQRGGGVGV